jgi:hypothetical protein
MGHFGKKLRAFAEIIIGRPSTLHKFFHVTVAKGKTVWPKTAADLLRYGVRWDYGGTVKLDDDLEYEKFDLQPNAGKIPHTIAVWRDQHGGTHAVIGSMYLLKGALASEEVFKAGLADMMKREYLA